jgi:hypothetical protein
MVQLRTGAELTVALASGEVAAAEVLATYRLFLEAGEGTSPNVLWDFSAATMVAVSSAEIRALAAEIVSAGRDRRRPGRTALVCPRDVDFGLARMLTLLVADHGLPVELCVFRERAEAIAWLGR